jgi:uncharacterized membrane protein
VTKEVFTVTTRTRMILITTGVAVGAISLYIEGRSGKVLSAIIVFVFLAALIIDAIAHKKRAS